MRSVEDLKLDGYTVIQNYFDALTDYNRMYRMREIERLRSDLYMGDLIRSTFTFLRIIFDKWFVLSID
ncbi:MULTISPECIES: hypothetical protein [Bifidobacterium]|uniref:hypothetical protein n=1 Tax=Bifidobacterium TaxID=1678 RepID=UPI001BDBE5DB|nr:MULTISPECIES: hypothetical protein [Bifidobacterium]MBT1161366.1 hypothetical protein [Bifidobacterium sp. SO1]MBW3079725.1 hypothetical protein [Bifidobacterium simiiventris]